MKRFLVLLGITAAIMAAATANSYGIGLSFHYFFPSNGDFSNPVAPIGLDDIGIKFGDYFGISTGLTLYNIGGMSIKGLDFSMPNSGTGPFLSLNIPLYAKLMLNIANVVEFQVCGGGFAFYNFNVKLNGNFDRALASYKGLDTLTSTTTLDNNIGLGWMAGGKITIYVTKQIGIIFGGYYLAGESKLNINGTYVGASQAGGYTTGTIAYPNAALDYRGIVLFIGGDYKM